VYLAAADVEPAAPQTKGDGGWSTTTAVAPRRACSPRGGRRCPGHFPGAIERGTRATRQRLAMPARGKGVPAREARRYAEDAVARIQDSLIVSRGLREPAPFVCVLKGLPQDCSASSPVRQLVDDSVVSTAGRTKTFRRRVGAFTV
jgi:hypothetical protein